MRRTDSFEKTLMLGMIEGGRRRGQQRMRLLDGITDSVDISLSKSRSKSYNLTWNNWWFKTGKGVCQGCILSTYLFNLCAEYIMWNARLPCPSLSPRVSSDSCPLSWWCYLTISSSETLFSFCLWYFPASGSFTMSPFPGLFPETNSSVILRSLQREKIRMETGNSIPINSEWYSIWLKLPLHHDCTFWVPLVL